MTGFEEKMRCCYRFSFSYALLVLMNPEAVTCSWVCTSAGRTREAAQEGILAGMAEVGMAQGTLGVGTQEEDGRAACTAAIDKTSF
jgi:hypothetical protein